MKLHHWKLLLGCLAAAAAIWLFWPTPAPAPKPIGPEVNPQLRAMTVLEEVERYLRQASFFLDQAKESPDDAALLDQARRQLDAALVLVPRIDEATDDGSDIDWSAIVALAVAVLGGLSSVILSWRKDLRVARRQRTKRKEDEPEPAEPPRIVLP